MRLQARKTVKRLVLFSSREAVVRACPRNLPAFRLPGRGVFWSPALSARAARLSARTVSLQLRTEAVTDRLLLLRAYSPSDVHLRPREYPAMRRRNAEGFHSRCVRWSHAIGLMFNGLLLVAASSHAKRGVANQFGRSWPARRLTV